jgi:hypothetical protein
VLLAELLVAAPPELAEQVAAELRAAGLDRSPPLAAPGPGLAAPTPCCATRRSGRRKLGRGAAGGVNATRPRSAGPGGFAAPCEQA